MRFQLVEFSYLLLFGGLAFFVYGLRLLRNGLQNFGENRFRSVISKVTNNAFKSFGIGIMFTALIQSSSATTVILVGLANSGLIQLKQAMGIILGAGLGTSITVQIISLQFSAWSILFIIFGILLAGFPKESKIPLLGESILGLGFIFYGMFLMSNAADPLRDNDAFRTIMEITSAAPLVSLILSMLFTFVVQSSAATLGVLMSLAVAANMPLEAIMPAILGANIGTCSTAILAGMVSDGRGKRVAIAHLLFKILGSILIFPLMDQFAMVSNEIFRWFLQRDAAITHQIANAHTLFNFFVSLVFLPGMGLATKALIHFVPDDTSLESEDRFKVRYLSPEALRSPALAQSCVQREIIREAEIVHSMFVKSGDLIDDFDSKKVDLIESEDDLVDFLTKKIRFYIAEISQGKLTNEQADRQTHLLNISQALEFVGDSINRCLLKLATKHHQKEHSFSEEGREDILEFYSKVRLNFDLAISSFVDKNEALARKVLRRDRQMDEIEQELRSRHILRLQEGLAESIETSSVHMEYLAELRNINRLITHMALSVVTEEDA